MHGVWRLTGCSAVAILLVSGHAMAQVAPPADSAPATEAAQTAPAEPPAVPAETLETPYEEPVPAPATKAPATPTASEPVPPVKPALPDTRPQLPIRAERRLVLTAEMGWNTLAGFGPVLTYHVNPHFSAELGVGLSLLGGKAGLRVRYNLLTSSLTPFVGVGFSVASGFGRFTTDPQNDPEGDPTREPATIDVPPAKQVLGIVGIDYIHRRGFTFVAGAGWSQIVDGGGYELIEGTLTEEDEKGFDIIFNGGLVITLGFGYAFK
jgi:hypothetical protein